MRFFDREKAVHVFLCLTVLILAVIGIGMTYKPVYVIMVDGQEVIAFETREEAETVLERVLDSYEIDSVSYPESEFKEAVAVELVHDNVEMTTDLQYAEKLLRNAYLTVVTEGFLSQTDTVPYEVEYQESDDLYVGQEKVVEEGREGTVITVTEVRFENGVEVSRHVETEAVIEEPRDQLILTGTKDYPVITSLMNPVKGTLSSRFGIRWNRQHNGVDIAAPGGTPIYAAEEGVVTYSQYNFGGYGYMVKISHGNGVETRYAHCSRLLVEAGDTVEQGEPIALVGTTGRSTGNHLHFEIRINGQAIDPLPYLTAYGGTYFDTQGDPISLDDLINGLGKEDEEDMAPIDEDILTIPETKPAQEPSDEQASQEETEAEGTTQGALQTTQSAIQTTESGIQTTESGIQTTESGIQTPDAQEESLWEQNQEPAEQEPAEEETGQSGEGSSDSQEQTEQAGQEDQSQTTQPAIREEQKTEEEPVRF